MPHIIAEATPALADALDIGTLFTLMHRAIADDGYAPLDDLKSRLHVPVAHLAGNDSAAEFFVARLITTNPRPPEELHAMAQVIHDVVRDAIERSSPSFWWQCCVLIEPTDKASYIRTDSRTLSSPAVGTGQ